MYICSLYIYIFICIGANIRLCAIFYVYMYKNSRSRSLTSAWNITQRSRSPSTGITVRFTCHPLPSLTVNLQAKVRVPFPVIPIDHKPREQEKYSKMYSSQKIMHSRKSAVASPRYPLIKCPKRAIGIVSAENSMKVPEKGRFRNWLIFQFRNCHRFLKKKLSERVSLSNFHKFE